MTTSLIPHAKTFDWSIITILVLALAAGACSRDPKAVKARYVASGDKYLAEGKGAEASVEYRNALEADAQDGEVRLKLAEAYAKAGEPGKAGLEYVRAADVLVDRPDIQVKAGNLLLLAGRFDDAKVRAEKALAVAPKDAQSQILLANSLAGLKDMDAAVAEIEEAIKLEPERSATYANLGVLEQSRGRREPAERAFRKAIELDARSAPAYLALANFYWVGGQWKEAEKELAQALSVDPDNILVHRAMAGFAVVLNRPDDAEKHLQKILDVTKSSDAAVALADFYMARKNTDAARNLLQPLTGSAKAATQANIRLAAMDHAAGRNAEAYATLDQVLTADKGNLQALLMKSGMLLSDGKRDEALAPAELAVQSHAESAPAFFTLGRVQAARNQTDAAIAAYKEALRLNPRATGAQVALARLHLASGRSSESVGFAQDAVTADPSNPDARLALVRGLIARGELQRAEPEVARLSAQYPKSAAVHVQKGMLLGRKKDFVAARKEFDQALALDPNSVEALGGLVALDLAAKQPDAARARLSDRASRDDATPAVLMLAARTQAATGDLQGSEQLLRRVLQKDSTYLPAYAALGQVYLRQRKLDAALTEFEAMAQRDAKPVAALTLAGIILQAQGKNSDAKARYERVMQLDPAAPVAANNLAWMHADSGGNLDVALQLAQTAHRGLPDSAEVNDTLGFVYYKKNLYALAILPLKVSAEKDPSSAAYHLHLGLAYAKSGNATGARQSLERALALKADGEGAQEARKILESLGGTD
jgi:putative PEP-CTERM system TPR-repeat lipoprotein